MTEAFFEISMVALLGAMSPGADTLLVTQNTLQRGRVHGCASALGAASGLVTHAAYSIGALAFLAARWPACFAVVRWAGAGYLFYLGVCALLHPHAAMPDSAGAADTTPLWRTFVKAYFTNVLNPKALLFLGGIFATFLGTAPSPAFQYWLAAHVISITLMWNIALACLLSQRRLRAAMLGSQALINRAFGCALVGLSFGLLLW